MVLNGPSTDVTLKLANDKLKIVQSYNYLGVTITAKRTTNLFKTYLSLILEKQSTRASTVLRHGFHKDGLRLATAVRLYMLLVIPTLEYCTQTLTYTRYCQQASPNTSTGFAKELEQFQTRTLKTLINCPRNTPPLVVRLFCGMAPIIFRL